MLDLSKWVGYYEHKTPEFLGIPNINIGKGYTIFAEMVKIPQQIPWCTTFVFAVHPKAAELGKPTPGSRTLVKRFKKKHLFKNREDYIPKEGDIIFLSNNRTDYIDHCGIVLFSDGKTVTTIEGNTRDPSGIFKPDEGGVVAQKTRDLHDTLIVGYGII